METFGYYEGKASVREDDGWTHILMDGQPLYDERYAWCGNFQEGRCAVRAHDGDYFHLRPDGKLAYSERYHYAGDFHDHAAVVQREDGLSTHIDPAGQLVHKRWFLDLDVLHKRYARARDSGGWHHVDERGCPAYKRRFAAVEPFYNGQARVECFDGSLEVIDCQGALIIALRPALKRSTKAETR
jgi:hypothetical protein